jgi:hypothetical protein
MPVIKRSEEIVFGGYRIEFQLGKVKNSGDGDLSSHCTTV